MRKVDICIASLLVLLATSVLAQRPAPGIEAKLVIPDTTTLPGVPFDMWIDVQNRSDVTIALGLYPSFLVRNESGGSFEINSSRNDGSPAPILFEDGDGVTVTYLELKPGAKQTLPIPIDSELAGPLPFTDRRLSPPGRYAVSIRLDRWPNTPPPVTFLGPVLTDEVTIERALQNETDKKVWQRMLELGDGNWVPGTNWPVVGRVGMKLVPEILSKYPDSNYVPYALLAASFGNVNTSFLNRILSALQRFPNSPVTEMLHLEAFGTAISSHHLGDVYDRERSALQASKRPTTRRRAFGREDAVKPCPPEYECEP